MLPYTYIPHIYRYIYLWSTFKPLIAVITCNFTRIKYLYKRLLSTEWRVERRKKSKHFNIERLSFIWQKYFDANRIQKENTLLKKHFLTYSLELKLQWKSKMMTWCLYFCSLDARIKKNSHRQPEVVSQVFR